MDGVIFDLLHTLIMPAPGKTHEESRQEYLVRIFDALAEQDPEVALNSNELSKAVRAEIANTKDQPDQTLLQHIITACQPQIPTISQMSDTLENLLQREDLVDESIYVLVPYVHETLQQLKDAETSLAIVSNTLLPFQQRTIMKKLDIAKYFDTILFSSECGMKKPSQEIVKHAQDSMSAEKCVVVGDMLDKDIKSANLAGMPAIWMNRNPYKVQPNVDAINSGSVTFDAAITSISQIPDVISAILNPRPYTVGYLLPTLHKRSQMADKNAFIDVTGQKILYKYIDHRADLEKQGPFNAIVEKIQELVTKDDDVSQDCVKRFYAYVEQHPEIAMVDPLAVVENALDRVIFTNNCIAKIGSGIQQGDHNLKVPWQHIVEYNTLTLEELKELMSKAGVSYPLMIKPLAAASSYDSHILTAVFNDVGMKDSLEYYTGGLIAQEFINHDSTVYKLYTLGKDHLWTFPRTSCANLTEGHDMVRFNSQIAWPEELLSKDEQIIKEMPEEFSRFVRQMVSEITSSSMFGFDLVWRSGTNDLFLVDFNYFSSYKEIPDLREYMTKNVLDHLSQFLG